MEVVKKKVSELTPSENNVRKHNQNQIKEFVKSIEQFGIIRPIVIDEAGTILCGHGLFEALKEKGVDPVDCIVMSGLSEKQKKKLMLSDNKIYDLGTNDYDVLDAILSELGAENDFEIPGYDASVLQDLYGLKAVEHEAEAMKKVGLEPTPVKDVDFEKAPYNPAPMSTPDATPSSRVEEQRREAMSEKRVIICPHCGGTIEL